MKRLILSAMTVLLAAANAPAAGSYGKVYWSDNQAGCIQRANLDGTHIQTVVANAGRPWGLAIDDLNGHLYWAEGDPYLLPVIEQANLDGSDLVTLISEPWNSGAQFPQFMALDVAGGKMYYTSGNTRSIERANLDGANPQRILTADLNGPVGIALDLRNNNIYWTHIRSTHSRICRSNLDGSGTVELLDQQGFFYDIELDLDGGYIYWADQHPNYMAIRRANLDGSNPVSIVTGIMPSGLALDLVNGKVYWSTRGTPSIQRANLDGTAVETLISRDNVPGLDYTMDVAIVHLPEPPVITQQPVSRRIYAGQSATFSVTATGLPPLTFQWQKNGTDLAGRTQASLTLPQAQTGDAAGYRVRVSNASGSVTSAVAILTVLPVPTNFPPSLSVPTNCGPGGYGSSNYQLSSPPDQPADLHVVGVYEGSVNANRTVTIRVNPTNKPVVLALSASAYCPVTWNVAPAPAAQVVAVFVSGYNPQTVSGLPPGVPVHQVNFGAYAYGWEPDRNTGGGNYRLMIQNVRQITGMVESSYQGCYAGNVFEIPFGPTPNTLPTIACPAPTSFAASAPTGVVATLSAWVEDTDGDALTVVWTVDGLVRQSNVVTSPNPSEFALVTACLTLSVGHHDISVSVSDGDALPVTCSTFVDVLPPPAPPVVTRQPVSQTNFVGSTVTFSVAATGTPPPSYQWQKNGTNLIGQTSTSLTLTNVQLTDAGRYRVIVANAAGSVTSVVATLTVLPLPASPGSLDLSFDLTHGGELLGLEGHRGSVQTLALQPDGKVIVGGEFIGVNGTPRYNLARLNPDGTLDPSFNPSCSTDGRVLVVTVQPDGRVIIGGEFAFANTVPRRYLARLNADGTLDLSFDAGMSPFLEGSVYRLVLQSDGKVVIAALGRGGSGGDVSQLFRLNSDGSADADFPARTWTNGYIGGLALQSDGKLLVGINVQPTNQALLRLNPDGTADPAFQPQLAPQHPGWAVSVSHIALQNDGRTIIQGGFIVAVPGAGPRERYARLNPDGSVDASFDAGANPPLNVATMRLQVDGKLLLGIWSGGLIRLNADGSRDYGFDPDSPIPGQEPSVNALGLRPDGRILVGRAYDSRYLEARDCVYQLQPNGRRDTNFFAVVRPAGAVVAALARQANGQVLIGGLFNHLNGQPLNGIGRLNADGSWDAGFRVALKPMDWVSAVVPLSNGQTLFSVALQDTSGNSVYNCVRLNTDGSVDSNFVVDLPFFYPVVIQPDGNILGIGSWDWDDGGRTRTSVVRIQPNGGLDPLFNQGGEGPDGSERSVGTIVLLPDGKILVGGEYESFNGVPRQGMARLHADGSLDPDFDLRQMSCAWVSAIAVQSDGKFVLGGQGFYANGTNWLGTVIRVHPDGSRDPSFNGVWMDAVLPHSLVAQSDGRIIVAGNFWNGAAAIRTHNIVRLNPDGSRDTSFDVGAGANGEVWSVLLQPDGQVVIGGYFSAVNGVPRTAVARFHNVVPMPFVTRQLPPGYVPGTNFTVRLHAAPGSNVSSYAVEDTPPTNWVVSGISHGGVFDTRAGKVKFGPFFDHDARLLSYDLTPPLGATGAKRFAGVGSADGINTSIGGADVISIVPPQHPADNSPADNILTISEVTAYGSAWRRGQTWPLPPNPIPVDYVTRAAALWRDGECYVFDATAASAPLWWVRCPSQAQSPLLLAQPVSPSALGTARRQMPEFALPTETLTVMLEIAPSPEARACAVEETIPLGLLITNITGGGVFDAVSGKIRWGPFLDSTARTVSYQVSPPADAGFIPAPCFVGVASFDGRSLPIAAASQWPLVCRLQAGLSRQDASVQFIVRGVAGARFLIETTPDLVNWTPLTTVTNTLGSVQVCDPTANGSPQRFYRARLVE